MSDENSSAPQSENPPIKRLFRSRKQRILGGICGGLAEYFNVDVVVIRVLWILITLFGGAGVIAYLILWIIVPPAPDDGASSYSGGSSAGAFLGAALILLGLALLFAWRAGHTWIFRSAECFPFSSRFAAWNGEWIFSSILPGLIIAVGLGFLIGWLLTRSPAATVTGETIEPTRLYRSRNHRMIAGVCSGLAQHFNMDPTIVRILWVIFGFASIGLALLVYVILIFVVPEEPVA